MLNGLDYVRFKRFVVSIVLRAHLGIERTDGKPLLTTEQFRKLVDEYKGKTEDVGLTGSFLVEHDPVGHGDVSGAVESGGRDQLSNLQLMFLLYFARTRTEVETVSMKRDGALYMREVTHKETGAFQDLDSRYRELMENPENERVRDKIASKYPADD